MFKRCRPLCQQVSGVEQAHADPMAVAVVTGAAGLVGAETVRHFAQEGFDVVGLDNDMRSGFFGPAASTAAQAQLLRRTVKNYRHVTVDVRNEAAVARLLAHYGHAVSVLIHTAAQPSHDWAAGNPVVDFDINARSTLTLLEAFRAHCPGAVFIYTSTNKVYGDQPNHLPLVEQKTRWEIEPQHPYSAHGIDESMSTDRSLHSLFGVSKLAADLVVQEYGRYFGLKTVCLRAGCLTGPGHAAVELHGFLAYLVKCAARNVKYTIYGHKGKQVRDNVHACDIATAFSYIVQTPPSPGEVYNIGGGRDASCSIVEAIELCTRLFGRPPTVEYEAQPRKGDHIWWISDTRRFRTHYPGWRVTRTISDVIAEISDSLGSPNEFPAAALQPEPPQR